jgi:hypothetical protein
MHHKERLGHNAWLPRRSARWLSNALLAPVRAYHRLIYDGR